MAVTYNTRKHRQHNVLYTVVVSVLICVVFLLMVGYIYRTAEDESYEMLHIQTKQIKDDLTKQIVSDRENLVTMSNFAAELYADGEGYDRMFESFKPIGLFSNIGILNPDNTFVTKNGSLDLNGKISFDSEAERGEYISGKVPDLTREGELIIRSAVPIKVGEEIVGILYGVIKPEFLSEIYNEMAKELDAQLFIYDKSTGNFVMETVADNPEHVSVFETRKYKHGYSYGDLIGKENGYTAFNSIYGDENLYIHYSTIEAFNWGIMLGRYESQVFAKAHNILKMLLAAFLATLLIIIIFIIFLLRSERRRSKTIGCASDIRKLLLEYNRHDGNIAGALKHMAEFSQARSAILVDADGEDYHSVSPEYQKSLICGDERKYLVSELFRYAAKYYRDNRKTIELIEIKVNAELLKENGEFYEFLRRNGIREISLSSVTDNKNHVIIIGVINPGNSSMAWRLLEEISVCFSIALYNKKHLNKTETAATTDALTGALNRVAYKKDILILDEDKPTDFSCIYIDVNELHLRNNKYGHASGDEMLVYVANTLKEIFYGQYIYRMGGDEFLVFVKHLDSEQVKKNIDAFVEQLKIMGYSVAIGMSYRKKNLNCEETVREAEIRMYEAKAQYYHNKEQVSISKDTDIKYVQLKTGIREVDTMLSVMKEHYNGIYRVSLDTDNAHRILMPSYLGYNEDENNFSELLTKYIHELIHPDYHRAVSSFLNYDALKKAIASNTVPKITYKKMNGETVVLSVYKLGDNADNSSDTLWVFAKA